MIQTHTISPVNYGAIKEIKDNDWDLSINRYKEIVYEEVEYDAPEIILNRIKKLDIERNLLQE